MGKKPGSYANIGCNNELHNFVNRFGNYRPFAIRPHKIVPRGYFALKRINFNLRASNGDCVLGRATMPSNPLTILGWVGEGPAPPLRGLRCGRRSDAWVVERVPVASRKVVCVPTSRASAKSGVCPYFEDKRASLSRNAAPCSRRRDTHTPLLISSASAKGGACPYFSPCIVAPRSQDQGNQIN